MKFLILLVDCPKPLSVMVKSSRSRCEILIRYQTRFQIVFKMIYDHEIKINHVTVQVFFEIG
jgi:hypothetical protein